MCVGEDWVEFIQRMVKAGGEQHQCQHLYFRGKKRMKNACCLICLSLTTIDVE